MDIITCPCPSLLVTYYGHGKGIHIHPPSLWAWHPCSRHFFYNVIQLNFPFIRFVSAGEITIILIGASYMCRTAEYLPGCISLAHTGFWPAKDKLQGIGKTRGRTDRHGCVGLNLHHCLHGLPTPSLQAGGRQLPHQRYTYHCSASQPFKNNGCLFWSWQHPFGRKYSADLSHPTLCCGKML
jgi:hypothetical protein